MKIVDKAIKKVYRFNCPNCQSRLEAESQELVDIGGKVSKFFCPVCKRNGISPGRTCERRLYTREKKPRKNYISCSERRVIFYDIK